MFNSSQILGLNARNRQYLIYNTSKGREIADSKLLTKKYLKKFEIPTPKVLKIFHSPEDVFKFDWISGLPDNFVLKPCSGFGGEGIIIVRKKAKFAGEWHLMNNDIINVETLRLRALDILAGQFSLHNQPDKAFIEERIRIRKIFKKYAFHGTPDIRVLVFNRVPVLAMLRLPTPDSAGRANLHQGAIGVGIDLATGITTNAIYKGQMIKTIPWTKRKINGLKIPHWNTILTLAVKAQEAIAQLGFLGVDMLLDKERGPLIVELNARPGLEIQNANKIPLKRRLDRVEGLEVLDADHGVRIAKALFAARFADRVMVEEGVKTLNVFEKVRIILPDNKRLEILAKIDTGAWRTSLDRALAENCGLLKKDNVLWAKQVRGSLGSEDRPVINFKYYLAGRKINTIAGVADRRNLKYAIIIGRRDLIGFLVRPQ
ncbi:MAG: sugar-transfer associated ATP-grasp domain-containing protein [Candidatus Shapirobacteria bacterium]